MFILFQILFITAAVLLLYTIFLYPVILIPVGLLRNRRVLQDDRIRTVDLIIPVHNGGRELKEKIENCLDLDYPKDSLNIIIVSDASSDNTVQIAQ